MSLEKRINDVIQWGKDRQIIQNSSPQVQCLKTMSEIGELADNLAKGRYELAKDDIGDVIVTLIMISEQIGTDIGECLDTAWDDIKDRRGHLSKEGVFIKETDYVRANALTEG